VDRCTVSKCVASFIFVILLVRISFRTIKEHVRIPYPKMIGSYVDSSCSALFMILKRTIDRPTINNLQLGKILRMHQGIPKGVSSSELSNIVSPISARNGINPKRLIYKKLRLTKGISRAFLDGFHVVFISCL